jgi:hypothetical protein
VLEFDTSGGLIFRYAENTRALLPAVAQVFSFNFRRWSGGLRRSFFRQASARPSLEESDGGLWNQR